MKDKECNKSCDRCTFPCCRSGEKLKPITHAELEKMGYIICDDFTVIPVEEQD